MSLGIIASLILLADRAKLTTAYVQNYARQPGSADEIVCNGFVVTQAREILRDANDLRRKISVTKVNVPSEFWDHRKKDVIFSSKNQQ